MGHNLRVAGLAMVLAIIGAAACGSLVGPTPNPAFFGDAQPYPQGCAAVRLGGEACDAAVEHARARLGVNLLDIESVDLLTEDRCGAARDILCTRSIAFITGVRFTLRDGSMVWDTVTCGPAQKESFCFR